MLATDPLDKYRDAPPESVKERQRRLIDERNEALAAEREARKRRVDHAIPGRYFYLCDPDGTRQSDDWYTIYTAATCGEKSLVLRFHYPEEIIPVAPDTRIEYLPVPRKLPCPKIDV